ncbi:monovalent cation/H(+) antiporter subunit G [Halorubrum ezzemoulense]|uniref:Multisubunit sodium/proton antiporter, MrpG subunit n=2 Tax=Halorubrum ezzemoulense TaxID=337243 RepID=A0A256JL91_HALEZ|nr:MULTISPECIES: monovalent cation/H(+) antiporter subunit G [Halorubrum]MDB2224998.1 monovalent cation/H(+) antiporter subunit G [Halorubrum ezzemoulense]MDB2236753.1 monovalent cation/H(+) antiporter subunit G [Halorubrum ezzemoulense]MDB2242331.1 monovalent cation/H(+) antiporter subunit G [Halorubrum ezzemoulense]MDB2247258.1 monovalent cation/H(+) antiporter subunit G [Halorubrum ezzemoulense]MDB2260853.1 monovalent cation/H(+) antiporter subunit G [Halorubrum ezzemoulense]
MTPTEWGIVALALAGAFFGGVAAVGLVRLPDVYTRSHAASKSDTLGAILAIAAAALALQSGLSTAKSVFLLLFMFITNPTAAHAVARAAQDQGIEPWTADEGDEP